MNSSTTTVRQRWRGQKPQRDSDQVLTRADLFRRMPWEGPDAPDWAPLVDREWLVTNGLGGYASGTVSGAATRRYHGLLIAAFPPPLGRMLMLADVAELLKVGDAEPVRLGGEQRPDALELHGARYLTEFRLEAGLPVWTYDLGGARIEKRIILPYRQNTAVLTYQVLDAAAPIELRLRPIVHIRSHDAPVDEPLASTYAIRQQERGYELRAGDDLPALRLDFGGDSAGFTDDARVVKQILYSVEASRGYASVGDRWSPGEFGCVLGPDAPACLVASTEPWDALSVPADGSVLANELRRRAGLVERAEPAAQEGAGTELVLAADGFIITPPRLGDAAEAHAAGEEACTIIAGYHWFTDWGRDTMISLEGLTLMTGRRREAGQILRTFGRHVRDGLIPNMFPEGENEGLYHTADASLWFFHAIDRYLAATGDRATLRVLLPRLREIVGHHLRGTRFGIGVDPDDGLLRQGAEGFQLTWMDAKVDGWVVTPRRGKAVEINALWYNALRLLERWEREDGDRRAAGMIAAHAARARESFNRRFWSDQAQHLYDVVDGENGDDASLRPNQIFAVSLPYAVLERQHWRPVVECVRDALLTPVGLRSLAPSEPDYERVYFGDLRARDAAYHQGTVWGWLIGPFIDAWLRVHPGDHARARAFLSGLLEHLGEACIGSLSEIFDAEEPHMPRGCVAQAWSVAEVLRCWVKTA
ncbi:MAG: amylo-alpha-1,6-glucosidase [Longimicrobiales bacterium]